MTLASFAVLADENINPLLVNLLRNAGFNVTHVNDVGLSNTPDHVILKYGYDNNQLILTLDDDFGTLVFRNKQPFIGIIRLRPGHLLGDVHVPTLQAILSAEIDYKPPFLLIAERRQGQIHIRYRTYLD
jgi:predicted nuclease of predicted toxin-antitoxin system